MVKKIDELTPNDLDLFAAWYFSDDDDVTIAPVEEGSYVDDYTTIVKTVFIDSKARHFVGYIYWGMPETVDYLKPVVFVGDEGNDLIYFWNGLLKPKNEEVMALTNHFTLPIKFKSESCHGMQSINGELFGLYFLKGKQVAFISNI